MTVERVDAIVLSGGSAFGLDAAGGVQAWLREQGRGFAVGDGARADRAGRDPVRPAERRRQELGPLSALSRSRLCGRGAAPRATSRSAASARASARPPSTSRAASARPRRMTRDGITVGAIVAVNAAGSVDGRRRPAFLGGAVRAATANSAAVACRRRSRRTRCGPHSRAAPRENTTLARRRDRRALTKAQAQAARGHGAGRARARDLSGAHAARRRRRVRGRDRQAARSPIRCSALAELGALAANVLARAIARGVYEATALPFPGALPSWKDRFGR